MLKPNKQCSYCDNWKSLEDFSPNSSGKFGVQSYCKPCGAVKVSDYRKKRPDKNKERYMKYNNKNKDVRNEKMKQYYLDDRDNINRKKRERRVRYKANGHCTFCKQPRYMDAQNCIFHFVYNRLFKANRTPTAMNAGDKRALTHRLIDTLLITTVCQYTGITFQSVKDINLDHRIPVCIDSSLAFDFDNLQWVSTDYNKHKYTKNDMDYLQHCINVVKSYKLLP